MEGADAGCAVALVGVGAALTLRLSPAGRDQLGQAPKVCNVLTYGAKGDNATEDTKAIQAAIDACAGADLGSVLLPSGHVYLTMPVTLPSHTTLVVEAGAVLLASPDIHRESQHPFFSLNSQRHLLIFGFEFCVRMAEQHSRRHLPHDAVRVEASGVRAAAGELCLRGHQLHRRHDQWRGIN